jgi:maleylpyruvate isomerase
VTPDAELAGARAATVRLLDLIDRTPDLSSSSLLPGWTRAHVVAHVAGNAQSHIRMLRGALDGVLTDQYAGGAAGRASGIDDLAATPAAAVAAVHETAIELDALWRQMSDWSTPVRPLDRDPRPAARLVWARWRELEVHAVDLAAGYVPADWPPEFVDRLLDELRARTDLPPLDGVSGPPYALAAWLAGRSAGDELTGDLPVLPEWC